MLPGTSTLQYYCTGWYLYCDLLLYWLISQCNTTVNTWHLHLTLLLYIPGTSTVHYFCTYLVPPPYTTPVHTWFLHFTLLLYNCYLVPPLYNTTVQYYCTGWYLHWELLLYWLVPSLCNTTYCVHTWYLHRTLLLYIPGTSTVHYYCTGWLAYVLCMTGKSPENKRSNYLKKNSLEKQQSRL